MKKLFPKLFGLCLFLALAPNLSAQLSHQQIDSLVEKTMETFHVPGIAVAVVKDGKVYHAKGYGVRAVDGGKVNTQTLFGIASNTKAFTSAALAKLVDNGKIEWDTRVTDIIPEFKLYNAYITREFTIRDLLSHRGGLDLGQGDLMVFPPNNTTTKAEMIHNLRYLEPVSSFRSDFHYNNLMFIVAGEIVERVSGMSYENFVLKNFVKPLGMDDTVMNYHKIQNHSNEITGYVRVDGKLLPVGLSFTDISNSAAGMWSSVDDLTKWVIARLDKGCYGKNLDHRLFSEEAHNEMWSPQTIIDINAGGRYNTHFMSYGLGWFISDVDGYKQVTHSGGLLGIVTKILMIPEKKLGIIVLTNRMIGELLSIISKSIKDAYLGKEPKDWIKEYRERLDERRAESGKIVSEAWETVENNKETPDLSKFVGTYNDPWFGNVRITERNGKLYFEAKKARDFTGKMFHYKANTFIVKWDDRTFIADSYMMFDLDKNGKAVHAKMHAISPRTDFSFDFEHLYFTREKNKDQNSDK